MRVTKHAKMKWLKLTDKKFETRSLESQLGIAEQEILRLLECAVEETPDRNPGLIVRMIENGFEEAKYFRKKKWRLVVVDDAVVTVEYNRFDLGKKKVRKSRKKNFEKSFSVI